MFKHIIDLMKLNIKNFLAFEGQHEVELPDSGIYLIHGVNNDEGGSNGSCKTGIFNALCYGLFGTTPREVNKKELSFGEKGDLEIALKFKDFTSVYSDTVNINGQPFGKSLANEKIEDILGFTWEQFLGTSYLYQGSNQRFLDLSDSAKKEFLFPLMKWEVIYDAIDSIRIQRNELRDDLHFKQQIELHQSSIRDLQQKIIDHQEKLERFRDEELKNIQESYGSAESAREAAETKRLSIGGFKESIEQQLNDLHVEYKKLRDVINENAQSRSALSAKISFKKELLIKGQNSQKDGKCITCNQPISNHTHSEVELADNKLEIEELEGMLSKLTTSDFSGLKSRQEDIQAQSRVLSDQLATLSNELSLLAAKAIHLNKEHKTMVANYERQSSIYKIYIEDSATLVATLDSKINTLEQNMQNENAKRALYGQVEEVLRLLQSSAIDSVIEEINQRVNEFLAPMTNENYELFFETSKTQANKKTVQKITPKVRSNNRGEVSLGSLSGGEYAKCRLAVDMAIFEIVQEYNPKIFPILMLDEVTHDIDPQAKLAFYNLLKQKFNDKLILIIEHHGEIHGLFNNITVEKTNGKARIHV